MFICDIADYHQDIKREMEDEQMSSLVLAAFKENMLSVVNDVPIKDNEATDHFSDLVCMTSHAERFQAVISFLCGVYGINTAEVVIADIEEFINDLTSVDVTDII